MENAPTTDRYKRKREMAQFSRGFMAEWREAAKKLEEEIQLELQVGAASSSPPKQKPIIPPFPWTDVQFRENLFFTSMNKGRAVYQWLYLLCLKGKIQVELFQEKKHGFFQIQSFHIPAQHLQEFDSGYLPTIASTLGRKENQDRFYVRDETKRKTLMSTWTHLGFLEHQHKDGSITIKFSEVTALTKRNNSLARFAKGNLKRQAKGSGASPFAEGPAAAGGSAVGQSSSSVALAEPVVMESGAAEAGAAVVAEAGAAVVAEAGAAVAEAGAAVVAEAGAAVESFAFSMEASSFEEEGGLLNPLELIANTAVLMEQHENEQMLEKKAKEKAARARQHMDMVTMEVMSAIHEAEQQRKQAIQKTFDEQALQIVQIQEEMKQRLQTVQFRTKQIVAEHEMRFRKAKYQADQKYEEAKQQLEEATAAANQLNRA